MEELVKSRTTAERVHWDLTERIIGAAIEVHRQLGPGFLEKVYEEALALEMNCRGIPFERQITIPVRYRAQLVGKHRLDFLVFDEIVVELKAISELQDVHFTMVRSYLRAARKEHGLLLNFSLLTLDPRRVALRPCPLS